MNFTLKSNVKGITLIALVITIVILLILAGVTIATLTGENGILTKVNEAKKNTEQSEKIEMANLYVSAINIELSKNNNFLPQGVTEIENISIDFEGMRPNIGWIYIENNILTKYEFYYDDFYILNVNGNMKVEDFLFTDLINVKNFGAIGDGQTDDTEAIKAAVRYLNENGGTLYFPVGTYTVSPTDTWDNIIWLNSDKEINIDFFASTIKVNPNSYIAYNVVYVQNCTLATVRNGFLVGDRKEHDYITTTSTHEWGYGIYFNQTTLGEAFNMDISDMIGDAIVNKGVEGTLKISECNLHHCRRQGISILDSDITNISNTNIHHIGTSDNITGTAPMTGIDIEPASGTEIANKVTINNVNIMDTSSYGIINSSETTKELEIFNSDITNINISNMDVTNSILRFNSSSWKILNNINALNSSILLEENTGNVSVSGKSTIDNCTFENVVAEYSSRVEFNSSTMITNTTFKNIIGKGPVGIEDNNRNNYGIIFGNSNAMFSEDSSNNIFENCNLFMVNSPNGSNIKIKDSQIWIDGEITLNNWEITDCVTTGNSTYGIITLNNCDINNSGIFRNCIKYLNNTVVNIDELLNGVFREGSICNNSTIHISDTINRDALKLIKFSNGSKVILDKYNDSNKITNEYSLEGVDYIVEYKGTQNLQ